MSERECLGGKRRYINKMFIVVSWKGSDVMGKVGRGP